MLQFKQTPGGRERPVDVADGFVRVTPSGRSKRRPYEENSRWARWGVDGWDFEIANSDSAARFAGATDKEELR